MSKVKDIVKSTVKKTDLTAAKTGSDPRDGWSSSGAGGGIAIPESIISNRADLLKKFYQSKGYNINYVSKNKRVAQSKMGDFDKWKRDHGINEDDQVDEHIVKTDGGYKLVSKKTGKNLGTASSLAGIKKREAQVQYFKHQHEEVNEDLTTKISHPETRSEVKHSPTLKRKRQLDQAASQYAIPAPAGTMKRTMAKEESQIDEVSLGDYKAKATQQSKELKKHTSGEYGDLAKRMLARREKGLKMASTREEVEELDEMDPGLAFATGLAAPIAGMMVHKAVHAGQQIYKQHKKYKAVQAARDAKAAASKEKAIAKVKNRTKQNEEIEQVDEVSSELLQRYKDKARTSADELTAKGQHKKAANRWMSHMTATGKQMSKATSMVKDIYAKNRLKEDMYDWEKSEKEKPMGKKPSMQKVDGTNELGDKKPKARMVLKGGTTLTGEKRDTVEIDPMLKNRTSMPDYKDMDAKKSQKPQEQ